MKHDDSPDRMPLWFKIGLILILALGLSTCVSAQDVRSYIPERCQGLAPMVVQESLRYTPFIPAHGYYGALIELESCITLKHSRCCLPSAELKTSREQGVGLGQITRAWDAKGNLRFDTLENLKKTYRTALKELSWLNIKERPDLQIRAIVLLTMENWHAFPGAQIPLERLKFADSAYNGGRGAVIQARKVCGLMRGCDPQYWDRNVEYHINKSKTPMPGYGGQHPYGINIHHVQQTTRVRLPKYALLYQAVIEQETNDVQHE